MLTVEDIKANLKTSSYDFLRDNPMLGNNILLLTVGGSYSYGTAIEASDLDMRGIVKSPNKAKGANEFFSFVDRGTDTSVFSVDSAIKLLIDAYPSLIETLGVNPEHILFSTEAGKLLIENRKLFLSKRVVRSFTYLSNSLLYKLNNDLARPHKAAKYQMHILRWYLTCIDILEKGDIFTNRSADLDLLMPIRNGLYVDKDGKTDSRFFDLAKTWEDKLYDASLKTQLPDRPNMKAVNLFKSDIEQLIY